MRQQIFSMRATIAVMLVTMVILGCGKKQAEISEGITPNALNFYILYQEIGAIREKVQASGTEQMPQYLPIYQELMTRSRKMLKDNETSRELKKYPEINSAMDSCLAAGTAFLELEARAIQARVGLADVKQQISDLRQSVKNNSILAQKQKPRMDALADQQTNLQKRLDGFQPVLNRNSQACASLLKRYNHLILQGKILEYTNHPKLFALFAWERPAEAKMPAKKTAKKKR